MAENQLQEWANRIDIGNDKKSDKDFLDIKSRLVKDMENLWNLKLQGKITQEEYSRYGTKFKEILEKNYNSKNEVKKKYEETRMQIMNETKNKTKGEQKELQNTDEIKEESIETKLFEGVFIDNLQVIVFNIETSRENIEGVKKIEELLENSFLGDQKFYKKFMKEYKSFYIINQACLGDKFSVMLEKFKKLELGTERKNEKLEKNINKLFGKEKGKELIEKIDSADACSFDLIKIINSFAKDNKVKLELKDIKDLSKLELEKKSEINQSKQNLILLKNGISQEEIDKARKNGKLEELEKFIPSEYKDIFNDSVKSIKKSDNAKKRLEVLGENDFKIITDPQNQDKSSQELMKILELQNIELAKLNQKIKKEEKEKNNGQKDEQSEIKQGQTKESKKISSQMSNSSLISIPKDFSGIDKKLYFKILLETVKKDGEKEIKSPSGASFKIFKDGEKFGINYGGIKHRGLDGKEIKNAISFANFTAKLGLNLLIPFSSLIINKINEKEKLVEDVDGLTLEEKNVIMDKIGKAIIPGFEINKTDIKESYAKFKTSEFKKNINDLNLNFQKNSGYINTFLRNIS